MSIRVLVIEDDERIAGVVIRGLREEGYTVEHAKNNRCRFGFPRKLN